MAKDALPPSVRIHLEAGNRIEAIKVLREVTGLGLKQAKDWIEAYERGGVVTMLQFGQKVVERVQGQMPQDGSAKSVASRSHAGLAPGQVASGGGSGKWLALVAVAILGVLLALYL